MDITPRPKRLRTDVMKKPSRILMIVSLLALGLFVTTTSGALDSTKFELEGNAVDDGATGADWQTLYDAAKDPTDNLKLPAGVAFTGIVSDGPAGDTSYFTGGGSKDPLVVSGWKSGGSSAPSKDEITHAFGASYPGNAGKVLYFGADRFDNSGDAQIGFWFFQNDVKVNANNTFAGSHKNGDLLVLSDFTNGGVTSTINVYKWVGSGGSDGALDHVFPTNNVAVDCKTNASGDVCGTTNSGDGVLSPWSYTNKSNQKTFAHGEFFEGGIELGKLFPNSNPCFASFLAETRSSSSPTAVLKDFVLHSFEPCNPSTSMSASPPVLTPTVSIVGDTTTYTFTETNDGDGALTNVYLTDNDPDCTLAPASVATLASGASAQFSCSVTSTTTGVRTITAVGHGTSPIGDVTICAAGTTPANTVCDAEETAQAAVVAIRPSTDIDVTRTPATVRLGEEVTFTITEKNDGVAPAGYTSSLDLTSAGVDTNVDECDEDLGSKTGDTGTLGTLSHNETWTYTCTVNAPADDFTLTATGTGTVLGRAVTWVTGCTNTATRFCDADEEASISTTVISPDTNLSVTASALVTYTFAETNAATDAPLNPPTAGVRESVLTLDPGSTQACSTGPTYVSGDTGNDFILGNGETWIFTCQGTLTGSTAATGTQSSTMTGIGHGTIIGKDVTYCAVVPTAGKICDSGERDGVTVTITNNAAG